MVELVVWKRWQKKDYRKCSKILNTSCLLIMSWQTVQTQIKSLRPRSDCFWRSSLIRVFPVCYSDKHFVNSNPDSQHLREKCLKFKTIYQATSCLPKKSKQTEQTQIRLALKKQSDQGLPSLLFWQAFCESSNPDTKQTFYLRKKKKSVWNFRTLTRTLVACPKGQDKQSRPRSDCFWRSSLIRVFPICNSDKHFANSDPDNQHFIWEKKEESVFF